MNGERVGIGVVIEGLSDSSYFCCAYTQRFCFVSTFLVVWTVGQLRWLGEVEEEAWNDEG